MRGRGLHGGLDEQALIGEQVVQRQRDAVIRERSNFAVVVTDVISRKSRLTMLCSGTSSAPSSITSPMRIVKCAVSERSRT
jgi:hypothetical protein